MLPSLFIHNNDGTLSYKLEGTEWQDFVREDRRPYSDQEYNEFLHKSKLWRKSRLRSTNRESRSIIQDTGLAWSISKVLAGHYPNGKSKRDKKITSCKIACV